MLMKSQIETTDTRSSAGRLRAVAHWLRRHFVLAIAAPMGVVLAIVVAAYYITVGRFVVSTDDAYVQADSTLVASRVSGYISAVLVND